MTVYGIDLGTCYSCIARNDGAGGVAPVELINNNGKKFVPSIVTFDRVSGQPKVGDTGKACLRSRPECTKAFVKREMHKEFCEAEISIAGRNRKISPVEVSACILKHLLDGANKIETGAGKSPATQAVITVPAKFDEQQRSRTKLAAQMAGIQVLGLLNEPTAAAIAYDIPAGNTVLVFDLGGGTLDVSIVTNDRGKYKVIGTPAGDDHLGGMDWDEKIIELAFQKVGRQPDRSNAKVWNLLMSRAEKIKQALTDNEVVVAAEVDEGNIIEDCEVEITRDEFEILSKELLERCWRVVDSAIANAKAQVPNLKIDFFLTVGGSSRMPMIRKGIIERYGPTYGKQNESDWLRIKDPDTAIAIGASKYAQMLASGLSVDRFKSLEDKATRSYGLRVLQHDTPVIMNLVKSTDPIVFDKAIDDRLSVAKATQSLRVVVYENNSVEEFVQINDSVEESAQINDRQRIIFDQYFDLKKTTEEGTPIQVRVMRDKDGLIKIRFVCNNLQQTFDVNPPDQLIDAETKANIERSLSLMKI